MTLKLVVADDSVTIQKIVSLAFTGEDVAIESASDGHSALESVRIFKPDVVLADVFMPGCSGYDVCARIKEDPDLGSIPVILLVGTFEAFDEAEMARVKADGVLTKPFDTAELIKTVHAWAGKSSRETASPESQAAMQPGDSQQSAPSRGLVSQAAMDSYLGKTRILDIFDPESVAPGAAAAAGRIVSPPSPSRETPISEEVIDTIVERVVRKMSSEVIREVAWEVVPELSESIIRETLQEKK